MSLLATQADFEQGGSGALYDPPYWRYPFFQERLGSLKQRYAPTGQKLLIVGCGFGYLVDDAVTAGYDAYGVDCAYAVGKGQALLPVIASRLLVADALDAASLDNAAKTAGLKGRTPKWALLVTEDVLPCMSDAEIQTALANLRARCTTNLLHMVTPNDQLVASSDPDPRLNWKSDSEWKALLSPPDQVYDVIAGSVV